MEMIEVQPEACLQVNCPARLRRMDVIQRHDENRLPDDAILRCTPEGVGPHGCRGDALHAVGMVREHMDGLLGRQVVHVHFCVGSTSH